MLGRPGRDLIGAAARTAVVAGILNEEEFAAKKMQVLGI